MVIGDTGELELQLKADVVGTEEVVSGAAGELELGVRVAEKEYDSVGTGATGVELETQEEAA